MFEYRASVDFRVFRRIEWDGGRDDLRNHVDEVVDALRRFADAVEVQIDADLDSTKVHLDLYAVLDDAADVDHRTRTAIATAIHAAGANPEALLSLAEEARLEVRGKVSGLKAPKWKMMAFNVERVTDPA